MRNVQAQESEDGVKGAETSTGPSILDVRFPLSAGFTAHLFEVPSRVSSGRERKHWIHLARDMVSLFLFVVDLDGYCEPSFENSARSQMEELILLFGTVVNSPSFAKTTPILVFHHVELFEEKLARYPFKKYFPEYIGGEDDMEGAVEHLVTRFNRVVKDQAKGRIPGYLISAEDKVVYRQVEEAVMKAVEMRPESDPRKETGSCTSPG
ncbi:G-protein alpha subunit domain containing protein [Naviculisporaceae sp. PSN 640]